MNKLKALRILVVFGCVLQQMAVQAQSLGDINLSNKLQVLNNKAYFNFPEGTKLIEQKADAIRTAPNVNDETRYMFSSGKARIVFFAQEMYMVSDKKLYNEVNADSAYKSNYTSKVFIDKDSVYAILSDPLKFDTTLGELIIKSLLVQTQDSTLFRIDAYINSEGFKQINEFRKLAENVFATCTKGSRVTNLKERDEKYLLADSTRALYFHLPSNYCITIDKEYDFQAFHFHWLRPFANNTWGNLVVYAGMHPDYTFKDYGMDEHSARKDSGIFLGNMVKYYFFNYDLQGLLMKEEVIPDNKTGQNEVFHVAMIANKKEVLQQLNQVAEMAKLGSR